MKKLMIVILLAFTLSGVYAQSSMSEILTVIESNSTTLKALREKAEAQKLSNRTNIFMPNPEVEFNYLWGNPSAIGSRQDFSVKQSFDFPSAYGYKNQKARLENVQVELLYKSERTNVLLEAGRICVELTYCNALINQYERRMTDARSLASAYAQGVKAGSANAIENNKAQMNLTKVSGEYDLLLADRKSLLSQLVRLNGGENIIFTANRFEEMQMPTDFDSWFVEAESKNPVLQYVKQQIEVSKTTVKLNKAMSLPKFSAGYMMENVVGQRFQGVAVGVSIPLWENRNKVRAAKAETVAATTLAEDTRMQFYINLQSLFDKSISYRQTAAKYRQSLSEFSNEQMLRKALDKGELTLLDYLIEIGLYYENMTAYLAAERDAGLTITELKAVEL